jgi:hypothetical protein
MNTVFRLVGYDRTSEFLGERHDIPARKVAAAKRAAGLPLTGDELMGDWPLNDHQAEEIAVLIDKPIDLASHEYFLEPYTVVTEASRHAKALHAA